MTISSSACSAVDFMQHADHGFALRHQPAHQGSQSAWCGGSRVGQRLVHQQHLRLHRQRTRQQHALAFAARQLAQRSGASSRPGFGAGPARRRRSAAGGRGAARAGAAGGPRMVTSQADRSSVPCSFLPQPRQRAAPVALPDRPASPPATVHCRLVRQPASTFSNVDLPAPLGPTIAGPAPGRNARSNPDAAPAFPARVAHSPVKRRRIRVRGRSSAFRPGGLALCIRYNR